MNNQASKARPEIINVNYNNPVFYPFSIKTSKCSGNCNINHPYTEICVPDFLKDLNIKVFIVISRTNETKNIKWHETCKLNVDQMQLFVIMKSVGIKVNADANVKN